MPQSVRQSLLAALFIILTTVCPSAPAQTHSVETDFHLKALRACLEAQAREFATILPREDLYNALVERNDFVVGDAPLSVGAFRIEYVSSADLLKRVRATKRTIPLMVLGAARVDGSAIVVPVNRYQISAKGKTLDYALEGGCRVTLRFDCGQQRFVVYEAKVWGV